MHSDLEAIVSADEEARSRVRLAEERSDRALADARASRDAAIDARRREVTSAFERELQSIHDACDARVAELQRQQAQYLASLAEAGVTKFDDAVAAYRRLVCEVTS
ncbi:MAG TPA: hypothetical protein VF787_03020 [Thermoanaerobaculia bacterium]